MRRWLLGASLVVVAYAYGQNERINSFHTDLTVAADGQLTVTEEINIHAEGEEFKRGIVRRLPLRFADHNGREHRVQYELTAVEVFGATSPYHTATEGDDFVLYVGSEGNFLRARRLPLPHHLHHQGPGRLLPGLRRDLLERERQRLGLRRRQHLGGDPSADRQPR